MAKRHFSPDQTRFGHLILSHGCCNHLELLGFLVFLVFLFSGNYFIFLVLDFSLSATTLSVESQRYIYMYMSSKHQSFHCVYNTYILVQGECWIMNSVCVVQCVLSMSNGFGIA